jgi:tetratricopeptide (TPR) repeat protein
MRLSDRIIHRLQDAMREAGGDGAADATPSARAIAGRYEVLGPLGKGGMGVVVRARDRTSGATVALKLIDDPSLAERFVREASILSELAHPGIVRYVDHGRVDGGGHYLAMELLEGITLAERLEVGELTSLEALALARSVAETLAAAHRRGIVHRDVKPSNLFLVDGVAERVKLLDFGIARHAAQAARMTKTGALVGTPGYMAPEQVRGVRDIDAAADVFALGCVVFECLSGAPPFWAEALHAVLAKILLEEAPALCDVLPGAPVELEDLLRRMLDKDPRARPTSDAVVRELAALRVEITPTRGTPAREPQSLTDVEQRIACVMMVREPHALITSQGGGSSASATLARAAEAFGARLLPVASDCVVALLGENEVATDQALIAAQCAIALRAASPTCAVALTTGRRIVGAGAAVGEAIDRAALLARGASAGEVRIDEATAALLGARFAIDRRDDELLLVAERDPLEHTRRLLGKRTPFVGRERELYLLESLFEECATEPMARVVLLTAPAGAGKTRLCHELLGRIRRQRVVATSTATGPASIDLDGTPLAVRLERGVRRVELWLGRGRPIGHGSLSCSPFGAIQSIIGAAVGLEAGEPAARARDKIRLRVAEHVPLVERERVAHFLGELAGVAFDDDSPALSAARSDPMLMGDQKRAAFETFLAAECSAHPVIVVVEDLQWADLPSIKLLDSALRNLAHRPWLLIALARPEVHDAFPKLWAGRPLEEIKLGELTRGASRALVQAALGQNTDPLLVERIVDRGQGNAFFLEEMVRSVAHARAAGIEQSPERIELPDTAIALVTARLAPLEPEARRVLRAASVFGDVFWRGAVMALLGATAGRDAAGWIDALVDRELVIECSGLSRFAGEIEYEFQHAAVREAAYAMLVDEDRRLAHRLAGEWLARGGDAGGDPAAIAEHFEKGGEPPRAAEWYDKAAEHALEGNDFARAASIAERAAAGLRGTASPLLGRLLLHAGEASRWRGDTSRALARLLEAAPLLSKGSPGWFRAAAGIMIGYGRGGEYGEVARWGNAAATASAVPGAEGAQIICLAMACAQLMNGGRNDAETTLAARAWSLSRSVAALEPLAAARLWQLEGNRAVRAGDPYRAWHAFTQSLARAETIGDRRLACQVRVNLGFALVELGALAAAEASLRQSLQEAESMNLHSMRAYSLLNLGRVAHCAGRAGEAAELIGSALAAGQAEASRRIEGAARVHSSSALLAGGQAAAAEAEARRAGELLADAAPLHAGALAARARALVKLDRAADACALAEQALALRDAVGCDAFAALVRLAPAEARLALRPDPDAAAQLLRALDHLRAVAATIPDAELARELRVAGA